MSTCSINPQININGKNVDSELYQELFKFFSNEKNIKDYFKNEELKMFTVNDKINIKSLSSFILKKSKSPLFLKQHSWESNMLIGQPQNNTYKTGEPFYNELLDFFKNNKTKFFNDKNEIKNINIQKLKDIVQTTIGSLNETLKDLSLKNTVNANQYYNDLLKIKENLSLNTSLQSIVEYLDVADSILTKTNNYLTNSSTTLTAENIKNVKVINNSYENFLTEVLRNYQIMYDRLLLLKFKNQNPNSFVDKQLEKYKLLLDEGYRIKRLSETNTELIKRESEKSTVYFLEAFNTNVKLTSDVIKSMLKKASDIGGFSRKLLSIKDVGDQILNIASVAFSKAKLKVDNLNTNDIFEIKKVRDKLINYQKSIGIDINSDTLYEFMRERIFINGVTQYSNRIISKYKITEFQYLEKIMWDKYVNSNQTRSDYLTILKDFYDENTNLKKDWRDIINDKIEEYKTNKINIKQLNNWLYKNTFNTDSLSTDFYRNDFLPERMFLPKVGGELTTLKNQWLSQQYIELQNNPVYKEYYDMYLSKKINVDKQIPKSNKDFYQLIAVRKKDVEVLQEKGVVETVKNKWYDFTRKATENINEEEYGFSDLSFDTINSIPIFFTTNILNPLYENNEEYLKTNKGLKLDDVSLDFTDSLIHYVKMGNNYQEMSLIQNDLELLGDVLKDRTVEVKNSLGEKVLDFFKSDDKTKIIKTINGSDSNSYKRYEVFLKQSLYGQSKEHEEYFGLNSKQFDKLLQWNSLSALSFNVFSNISNITMGSFLRRMEATGGNKYKNENLNKAYLQISKDILNIVQDSFLDYPENKINLWLIALGIDKMELKNQTKIIKLLKSQNLMIGGRIGEHFIKSLSMLSILDTYKDSNGNSVFENSSIVDGKLIYGDNFDFNKLFELSSKIKEEIKEKDGAYDVEDILEIERVLLGRAILQFRKWTVPSVMSRFKYDVDDKNNMIPYYNQHSRQEEIGYYISTYLFAKNIIEGIKQKDYTIKLKWDALTDLDKSNIKKTGVETLYLLSTYVLYQALKAINDDDEDKSKTLSFLSYQARRLNTEILFYVPILGTGSVLDMMASPIAATKFFGSLQELTKQVFGFEIKDGELDFNINDLYLAGYKKGDSKTLGAIQNIMPVLPFINKSVNINDLPE